MTIDIPNKAVQSIVRHLLKAGLDAADPEAAIRRVVQVKNNRLRVGTQWYDLTRFERIVCVGAGKASGAMAAALERIVGSRLEGGIVVVHDAHGHNTKRVQLLKARHPVPDYRSERAARKILELLGSLTHRDLVFLVLSGGASSLLAAPAVGLTLREKQRTTQLLLRSGATIREINTVRKHLSRIKGGQLAGATSATILTLVLSDVPGDDLATIGSGPTAPDPTTFSDAKQVLTTFQLWDRIPLSVQRHINQGIRGRRPETPKSHARLFSRVRHHIVGNNQATVQNMAVQASALGLGQVILSTALSGEARDIGKLFGTMAKAMHGSGNPVQRPWCLIAGGELTVTVRGRGKGGRAQEFALAAAPFIEGVSNMFVVGVGTDGRDGPTDAAGAIVDGRTMARAKANGADYNQAMRENDSHGFFRRARGHIVTGPTGTNVNDLYLIVAL